MALIASASLARADTVPTLPVSGSSTSPAPGATVVTIQNPLKTDDLLEFINEIIKWIVAFAVPIATAMIIWAGLRMVTARGNLKTFEDAKKILQYTLIGLAVIFIGGGFVRLVESILDLGGSPSSNAPAKTSSPSLPR